MDIPSHRVPMRRNIRQIRPYLSTPLHQIITGLNAPEMAKPLGFPRGFDGGRYKD